MRDVLGLAMVSGNGAVLFVVLPGNEFHLLTSAAQWRSG